MEGLLAPREAPILPRMRSGARSGSPRLQEGRGGRWGGVLTEAWHHIKPDVARVAVKRPCLIRECTCLIDDFPCFIGTTLNQLSRRQSRERSATPPPR
jgi:hypothetical protein